MRRFLAMLPPLLWIGCSHPDRPAERPGAAPPPAAAARPDTGGTFVLLRGADTLVTERYSRSPGRLEGELRAPGGRRWAYRAEIGPAQLVTRLEQRWIGRGAPLEASAVFGGDSVVRTVRRGTAPPGVRRDSVPPGSVAYVLPSAALAEQVLRRARALGGDSVQVPVAALGPVGIVRERVRVRWFPGDSVRVSVSGNEVWLMVDPAGRILGARNPNLDLRLERVGGG